MSGRTPSDEQFERLIEVMIGRLRETPVTMVETASRASLDIAKTISIRAENARKDKCDAQMRRIFMLVASEYNDISKLETHEWIEDDEGRERALAALENAPHRLKAKGVFDNVI
jgi:hypothetical protein